MAKCAQLERNKDMCTCTYSSCSRKGNCCDCIKYHNERGEVPGCLFPPEAEKTYDRSKEYFAEVYS